MNTSVAHSAATVWGSRALQQSIWTPRLRFERALGDLTTPVYALALPSEGVLMISEMDTGQVKLVDLVTGNAARRFGADGAFSSPTGLARSSSNDIYVGQQGSRGLLRMGRDGTLQSATGRPEDADIAIESALGVSTSASSVFVADVTGYRVLVYDSALQARSKLVIDQGSIPADVKASFRCTERSAGGQYKGPSCFNPHGVAWTTAYGGRLYVSDPDNGAIFSFSARGQLMRTIRDPALFGTPRGIAVWPRSSSANTPSFLVVAERERILLLSLSGKQRLDALHVPGATNMLGVAVDEQGSTVYVADPAAAKVFVLTIVWAAEHDPSDIVAVEASRQGTPSAWRDPSSLPEESVEL